MTLDQDMIQACITYVVPDFTIPIIQFCFYGYYLKDDLMILFR